MEQASLILASRLDDDFVVFRGSEHESAGQLVKGVVVLCLPQPLKVEEIRLKLTGILHFQYVFSPLHVLSSNLESGN